MNLMIHSGYVGWMDEPAADALRQDELCNRNMCALTNNFVDFGFVVLLDTVLADRAELDFFLALLSPRPVRLVVLAPGIDACRARDKLRRPEERSDFDGYERLEADMTRAFRDIGWRFYTSSLTPDETAEALVTHVCDRAAPLQAGWHTWLRELHGVERPRPHRVSSSHTKTRRRKPSAYRTPAARPPSSASSRRKSRNQSPVSVS